MLIVTWFYIVCNRNPCSNTIVIKKSIVSYGGYGWCTRGSIFFDLPNAVNGYVIYAEDCSGNIISTTVCSQNELQKYIDMVKYEILSKDSVVSTNPINQIKH